MKFSVIICGSRNFQDYESLKTYCDRILSNKKTTHKIVVISGCARGADTLAIRYAKENGLDVERYPAQWDIYGKQAGFIRNKEMQEVADACIAFPLGVSKGTHNMISLMKSANKPCAIFKQDTLN